MKSTLIAIISLALFARLVFTPTHKEPHLIEVVATFVMVVLIVGSDL